MRAIDERPRSRLGGNLPPELSSFVGREQDVRLVRSLVDKARLVTLTGPGGVGKTRLALRTALDVERSFPGGVWVVELATLRDGALLTRHVADALKLGARPGYSVDSLGETFGHRGALLILDNCEHLLDACAAFTSALLRANASIRILATSRTALGAEGEIEWHVPPLRFPDRWEDLTVEEASQQSAIQLLVDRAQAVDPSFTLNEENVTAVGRLCHQLDGLPLAIELVAARTRVLAPRDIAAGLKNHLDVRAHANGSRPSRHQTLRASVTWSYDLLSEAEQEMFARLSVFVGGCDLRGAMEVAGLQDEDVALELLTHLVEKSLVMAERSDSQVRFRMLETLRQYGVERLAARDALNDTQRRHARMVGLNLDRYERGLRGSGQVQVAREVDREYGNICAVLEWSLENDPDLSLAIVAAIGRFWLIQSRLSEGRRWTRLALEACPEPNDLRLRDSVLVLSAVLASYQGDAEGMRWVDGKLRQHRMDHDHESELWRVAGSLAALEGDFDRTLECYEACLDAAMQYGSPIDQAWANAHVAWARIKHADFRGAVAQLEPSIALLREVDDQYGVAWLVGYLAEANYYLEDTGRAFLLYEESLALFAQLGVPTATPSVARNMALLTYLHGDRVRAIELFRHALRLALERGPGYLAGTLMTIARIQELDRAQAAALVGAADDTRERHGFRVWPADEPVEAQLRDSLCSSLGEPGFAAAYARGRALPQECVFHEGMEAISRIAETLAKRMGSLPNGLSQREVEVLRLVADGQTNREIAEALTLSRKTIERHLERIFAKIDVRSRAAATRFAVERGLTQGERARSA